MAADRARKSPAHTDLSQEEPSDRADSFGFHFRFGPRGGAVDLRSHGAGNDLVGRVVAANVAYAITCVLAIGCAWITASLGAPLLTAGAVGLLVFLTGLALVVTSMRSGGSRPQTPPVTPGNDVAEDTRLPLRRQGRRKPAGRKRGRRG